jgi:hypothetical protein
MRALRRNPRRVVMAVQLFELVLAGCASAIGASPDLTLSTDVVSDHAIAPRNTLTRSDLAATNAVTMVDALMRLRPEFLRGSARGPLIGKPEIAVYLNNQYAGEPSTLNTIPLSAVKQITFLQPTEARSRFGSFCACANGAILITTLRVSDR